MQWWTDIRRQVLVAGVSKREVLRQEGMHWTTLEKVLTHSAPPGYRRSRPPARPKLGPYMGRIEQILEEDKGIPRKQRHTAKRIFERLQEEGYTGGYTQVKEAVRALRQVRQEVFMPLVHRPGEAQMDVGEAVVKERGHLGRAFLFVVSLPYSGAVFVQAFARACTETFWEAHRRAFEFFGGVPWQITYDNDTVLVSAITGPHERKLTHGFLQLQSHYLFDAHFCNPGHPNEKGTVEAMVKFARQSFLVPVPQVNDLEELNAQLWEACRADLSRRMRGKGGTKEELLAEDRAAFLSLPEAPFDACRKVSTTASSLSLVRFDCNDYSVPVQYAHGPVVVKGYVDRVQLCHKGEVIATHARLWGKEQSSFDPIHYLALLERKPGALDHARPLAGWELPECFEVLRRRQEDEQGGQGTREYIQVLRLLETHSLAALTQAVEKALRINALSRDAIAQFLIPQEDFRQTTFRLEGHPHLRHVKVAQTRVSCYRELLGIGGPR
jgi:transposase